MVHLDLWKCLLKKESFELGFEAERVGRFHKLAGNECQTDRVMKLKERSPTDLRLCLGIFNSFSLEDQRVLEVSYVQREAEK